MSSTPKNKIAVLIISCDKYSDLWDIAIKMFFRFWPDCPYDRFITTNNKECNIDGFSNIQIGDDKSWSLGLKKVLTKLEGNYDYVFTMLEDYYFIDKIDNKYITKMFDSFVAIEGNFLSLFKLPSRLQYINEYFGELENNIPYRQSCVFTLWKISTLKNILKDDENAWEFEKIGVKRGFEFEGFYGSYYNYRTINLIVKGKIVPRDYKILKIILPNTNVDRPTFSNREMIIMKIRDSMVFWFLKYTPAKLKYKIYFK